MTDGQIPVAREAVFAMPPDQFRDLGHGLVDALADFLAGLPTRAVTGSDSAAELRSLLPSGAIPEHGAAPGQLLADATRLLIDHSLFNGHPRFFGYITAGPAPIGVLAELLAAAINANVGGATLAPIASAIEEQTIRWIAELMGYRSDCGGLLVSGGNMANIVAFFAARRAHADWNLRQHGVGKGPPMLVYASTETHTWLHKAADLSGIGTDAIRWVPIGGDGRMDTTGLAARIAADRERGGRPFLLIGTAGTVATGAVDPLPELARIAREQRMWFHVDGAYGGVAAALLGTPESSLVPSDLAGLREADSIALDPHKWLYAPLEAGCVLVRRPEDLRDAFSYKPSYYRFDNDTVEPLPNYYELGPQNSRGFRALKVWLQLRQAGRAGYRQMMADDIRLARRLQSQVSASAWLEPGPGGLSIATFRYVPRAGPQDDSRGEWLDTLNTELLDRLQRGGEAFVSNAVINGCFWLRACIVNFRTGAADVDALVALVERIGDEIVTAGESVD
ncbi:MAG: aspartate aminotransferase family protein [Lysobacter sp.]|nr:aspartate aminotransferase family protein [Lysobacter sp.]MDQ3269468.1 pyridoxal-dependent decarboxylase [Pseudomonadota bacterium]